MPHNHPVTEYPNREHAREVQSQTNRAIDALAALIADAEVLRRKLTSGNEGVIFGSEARQLTERCAVITERCSQLEALRHSREWWLADQAEIT